VQDNLAVVTALSGEQAHAETLGREALRLRRELAGARPDAYRPQLASTLYNLAQILLRAQPQRVDEARKLLAEAEHGYSKLAERRPDRFAAQLALVRRRRAAVEEHADGR